MTDEVMKWRVLILNIYQLDSSLLLELCWWETIGAFLEPSA